MSMLDVLEGVKIGLIIYCSYFIFTAIRNEYGLKYALAYILTILNIGILLILISLSYIIQKKEKGGEK